MTTRLNLVDRDGDVWQWDGMYYRYGAAAFETRKDLEDTWGPVTEQTTVLKLQVPVVAEDVTTLVAVDDGTRYVRNEDDRWVGPSDYAMDLLDVLEAHPEGVTTTKENGYEKAVAALAASPVFTYLDPDELSGQEFRDLKTVAMQAVRERLNYR